MPQQTPATQAPTPHIIPSTPQTLTTQQSNTPFHNPFGRAFNRPLASPSLPNIPSTSTSASASREENIQLSLVQLFKPYDRTRGGKVGGRRGFQRPKETKVQPWTHDFFCLAEPGAVTLPSDHDKCTLQKAGLGRKTVVFPDKKAKHLAFEQAICDAYPKLKDAGG
ncbi:hypothetical protein SKAU_G00021170, partial [Synaphobranchus kaupii]